MEGREVIISGRPGAFFSVLARRQSWERADCVLAYGLFACKYIIVRGPSPRAATVAGAPRPPLGAVSPLQTARRSPKPLLLARNCRLPRRPLSAGGTFTSSFHSPSPTAPCPPHLGRKRTADGRAHHPAPGQGLCSLRRPFYVALSAHERVLRSRHGWCPRSVTRLPCRCSPPT